MTELRERLYQLLPRLYRRRDEAQGQPLRALMAVLDAEFATLETDMLALYDNWFIETCDEWALPYLADLVDAGPLGDGEKWHYTQRRRIANTIAYRRRQGTVATLENVIRDETGWTAKIAESSRLLSVTQHVTDVRQDRGQTVDLRDALALSRRHGAFNDVAHAVEIPARTQSPIIHWPAPGRPPRRYRPNGLTVFLWRLGAYAMTRVTPCLKTSRELPPGCFTFDPVGRDQALFNVPESIASIEEPLQPIHVPMPISRAVLAADLADAKSNGKSQSVFFGPGRSVNISRRGQPLPPHRVASANLDPWPDEDSLAAWREQRGETEAVIDVQRGRFVWLGSTVPTVEAIEVDYTYGFSDDMGGGPYGRGLESNAKATQTWIVARRTLSQSAASSEAVRTVSSLNQALTEWNQLAERFEKVSNPQSPLIGQIWILDNTTYEVDIGVVRMPQGAHLTIAAADEMRPAVRLDEPLAVHTWRYAARDAPRHSHEEDACTPTQLELNGLLIDGQIEIRRSPGSQNPAVLDLTVSHCTLVPLPNTASLRAIDSVGRVDIDLSIVGRIELCDGAHLYVSQTIIDGGGQDDALAIARDPGGHGVTAELSRATIFGAVRGLRLELAENVLFTRPLEALKSEPVRFSYVPADDGCAANLQHAFTSMRPGDPAYAQLGAHCPEEILHAGEDGSQPGAFHRRYRPQRLSGLQRIIDEFAPLGQELMVEYVT